jgi:arylsulfatase A-like enzyme/thioredoxin-like negative regulator of GroEL
MLGVSGRGPRSSKLCKIRLISPLVLDHSYLDRSYLGSVIMRGIRGCLWVIVFAASALAGTKATEPQSANSGSNTSRAAVYPNIILITLDTTRADRMDFLGSKRGLTPNLDILARDSAIFTRAYSQAPLTETSHATILTGTYPQYHQVVPSPLPLNKDLPYLPDILKAKGYATAAFIGSFALDPTLVGGFDRGFDLYDAGYSWRGFTSATRYQTVERRGGEVVDRALAWLSKQQQQSSGSGPFFLWVHIFDPHEPYEAPEPFKTRYAKEPYDGEIAYVDSVMGTFFAKLKASGLYDTALIALTADHGESLGAHGEDTHGVFLYDETIHVPLLIKLPGTATASSEKVSSEKGSNEKVRSPIEVRVELADILPTLLRRAGIEIPAQVQGESLLKLMRIGPEGDAAAEAWRDRGAFSRADYGRIAYGWSSLQSLRSGKYLYVQAPRRELYDEAVDPNSEHNLVPASSAVADTLSARLTAFEEKTTNPQPTVMSFLDDDKKKKLAALGYQADLGSSHEAAPIVQRPDPKDFIEVGNLIYRANRVLQDFHCPEAVPKIEEMIAASPNIAPLHFFVGRCLVDEKKFDEALPQLRAAVKLDPGFAQAEMYLGLALMQLKDFQAAAAPLEDVVTKQPQMTDAHIFLITVYANLDRVSDGIRECRKVLETIPNHYLANLSLGEFLAKSGDAEGAIPILQKAASLRPSDPAPHQSLADAYTKLGRQTDAEGEQAAVTRLASVK